MKTLTNHNTTLVEEGEVAQYPLSHPTQIQEKEDTLNSRKCFNSKTHETPSYVFLSPLYILIGFAHQPH